MNLELNNKGELLALHRLFLEAKYNNSPVDHVIHSSPIVKDIYERLHQLLVEEDEKNPPRTITGRSQGWLEWRQLELHVDKIDIIKQRLKDRYSSHWNEMSHESQVETIENLACPLIPTVELINELSEFASSLNSGN